MDFAPPAFFFLYAWKGKCSNWAADVNPAKAWNPWILKTKNMELRIREVDKGGEGNEYAQGGPLRQAQGPVSSSFPCNSVLIRGYASF